VTVDVIQINIIRIISDINLRSHTNIQVIVVLPTLDKKHYRFLNSAKTNKTSMLKLKGKRDEHF
jgi:hypothetical protein